MHKLAALTINKLLKTFLEKQVMYEALGTMYLKFAKGKKRRFTQLGKNEGGLDNLSKVMATKDGMLSADNEEVTEKLLDLKSPQDSVYKTSQPFPDDLTKMPGEFFISGDQNMFVESPIGKRNHHTTNSKLMSSLIPMSEDNDAGSIRRDIDDLEGKNAIDEMVSQEKIHSHSALSETIGVDHKMKIHDTSLNPQDLPSVRDQAESRGSRRSNLFGNPELVKKVTAKPKLGDSRVDSNPSFKKNSGSLRSFEQGVMSNRNSISDKISNIVPANRRADDNDLDGVLDSVSKRDTLAANPLEGLEFGAVNMGKTSRLSMNIDGSPMKPANVSSVRMQSQGNLQNKSKPSSAHHISKEDSRSVKEGEGESPNQALANTSPVELSKNKSPEPLSKRVGGDGQARIDDFMSTQRTVESQVLSKGKEKAKVDEKDKGKRSDSKAAPRTQSKAPAVPSSTKGPDAKEIKPSAPDKLGKKPAGGASTQKAAANQKANPAKLAPTLDAGSQQSSVRDAPVISSALKSPTNATPKSSQNASVLEPSKTQQPKPSGEATKEKKSATTGAADAKNSSAAKDKRASQSPTKPPPKATSVAKKK